MNLQINAEGAAASPIEGMLGGIGPTDKNICQAAPGRVSLVEASQGSGGRAYEARPGKPSADGTDVVDPLLDHSPTWQPQRESRTYFDDTWCMVGRRGKSIDAEDSRSLVIWGVPLDVPEQAVKEVVDKNDHALRIEWKGAGNERHIRLVFNSSLARDALFNDAKKACKAYRWRAAVSRTWRRREKHRATKQGVSEPRAPMSNPFAVLGEDSKDDELAAPGQEEEKVKVSKKGKSQAVKASRELTHRRIKAGTFNLAKGLRKKVGELEVFLTKKKFDVVALQECGKGPVVVKGFKAFCHPNGEVAILVALRLVAFVAEVKSETSGQLWVRIAGSAGRKDIYVCSAYMLQESEKKEARETAFGALQEAARRHATKGELLLMGDLNARIGAPTNGLEKNLIGQFGENGRRSDNGRLVLDMMKQVGLVNQGGQRPLPPGAAGDRDFWYTRFDPQRKVAHAIDYILITGGLKRQWSRFKVDYTHLGSDHHILVTEVTCPREIQKNKKREVKVCFRMEKFIQKSSKKSDVQEAQIEREAYERELVAAFKDFDPELADKEPTCDCSMTCACGSVKNFIRRTEEALENSCGSKRIRKGFSRPWFDDEVKSLVEMRREAHKRYMTSPKLERWQEFTKARTRCGKAIKKKKAGLWQEFIEKFDDAYKGNHKIMWNLVRRLVPSSNKIPVQPIKGKDGQLATSEEEILEAWANHQSKLGTPSRHSLQDDVFTAEVEEEVARLVETAKDQGNYKLGMEFTREEIRKAVDTLDYYKAGAADGTKNPMFKCGGEAMEVMLYRLFNYLRSREIFPEDWGRSEVVNLFKEGDKSDPGNYRGISLISCLGKLYLSLWAKRLADFLEPILDDEQGGFRWTRSTVDQALTLKEILVQRKRSGNATYLCFVDFRKAFDTVWHDGLWKRMWDSGIKGKPWRIIRNLYSSISSSVKVGGKTSRRVQMRQGVRQGSSLSNSLQLFYQRAGQASTGGRQRLCSWGEGCGIPPLRRRRGPDGGLTGEITGPH